MSTAGSNSTANTANAENGNGGGRVRQYAERERIMAPREGIGTHRTGIQSKFISRFTGKPCKLQYGNEAKVQRQPTETAASTLQTHPRVQMHPLLQSQGFSRTNSAKNSLMRSLVDRHNAAVQRAMEEDQAETVRGSSVEPEKVQTAVVGEEQVQQSAEKLHAKANGSQAEEMASPSAAPQAVQNPEIQTNISPTGETDKNIQSKPQGPYRTRADPGGPVRVRSASSEFGAVQRDGEEVIAQKSDTEEAPGNAVSPKNKFVQAAGQQQSGTPELESELKSSKGGGSPMADADRGFFESRMGADFSNVRIHTGSNAVQMNEGLGAKAFAHGSDIYFNANQYQPGTSTGKHLLAHELTHTVQQGGSSVRKSDGSTALTNRAESESAQKSEDETAAPKIQTKCESCAAEEGSIQKTEEEAVQQSEDETASPKIQTKCASCAAEEAVQKSEEETAAPQISRTPHSALNLQPSLKIGQPGDKYEQEADATADKVMTMSDEQVAPSRDDNLPIKTASPSYAVAPKSVQRLFGIFDSEDPCADKKPEPEKSAEKDSETRSAERTCEQRNPPAPEAPEGTKEPDQDSQPAPTEAKPGASADERQSLAPSAQSEEPNAEKNPGEKVANEATGPCGQQKEPVTPGPGAVNAIKEGGDQKPGDPDKKGEQPIKEGAKEKENDDKWLDKAAGAKKSPLVKAGGLGEKASPDLMIDRNKARGELASARGSLAQTEEEAQLFDPSAIQYMPSGKNAAGDDEAASNSSARNAASFGKSRILEMTKEGADSANEVMEGVEQKKEAIRSIVRQKKAATMAVYALQLAQTSIKAVSSSISITLRHMLSTLQIRLKAMATRQAIQAAREQASKDLRKKGEDAFKALDSQYFTADMKLRGIGVEKGKKAKQYADERASAYKMGEGATPKQKERVIHKKKDGFWDGYLTYNRYRARADSAKETGKQYAEGFEKEANKKADAIHCGKSKDIQLIEATLIQGEDNLKCSLDQSIKGVDAQEKAALDSADGAKKTSLDTIKKGLKATHTQLKEKKDGQLQFLNDFGIRQEMAIERDASYSVAGILQQTAGAAGEMLKLLKDYGQGVSGSRAPPAKQAAQEAGQLESAIGQQASAGMGVIKSAKGDLKLKTNTAYKNAQTEIITTSGQGIAEIRDLGGEYTKTTDKLTQGTLSGLSNLAQSFTKQQTKSLSDAKDGFAAVLKGVDGFLKQIRDGTQKLFDEGAKALQDKFQSKIDDDLPMQICVEAEKAAAQVEPWWKSALKILLIIVVVLVVVLVIGPAVIAAAGAAASALAGTLGASAALAATISTAVTTLLTWAIEGIAVSVIFQAGMNFYQGVDVFTGMKEAIIIGAILGPLGGMGGKFAGVLLKGTGLLSILGRFGIRTAFLGGGLILSDVALGREFNLKTFLQNLTIITAISLLLQGIFKIRAAWKSRGGRNLPAKQTAAGESKSGEALHPDSIYDPKADVHYLRNPNTGKYDLMFDPKTGNGYVWDPVTGDWKLVWNNKPGQMVPTNQGGGNGNTGTGSNPLALPDGKTPVPPAKSGPAPIESPPPGPKLLPAPPEAIIEGFFTSPNTIWGKTIAELRKLLTSQGWTEKSYTGTSDAAEFTIKMGKSGNRKIIVNFGGGSSKYSHNSTRPLQPGEPFYYKIHAPNQKPIKVIDPTSYPPSDIPNQPKWKFVNGRTGEVIKE